MKRIPPFIFLCALIILPMIAHAQNYNRPVPGGFPQYEFELNDSAYNGYYFTSAYFQGLPNVSHYIGLLDDEGYIAWWAKAGNTMIDFKYLPDHNRFTMVKTYGNSNIQFIGMDQQFQLIDSISAVNGFAPDSHEFLTLANGNRLIITRTDSVMDLSAYTFSGQPGLVNTQLRVNGIQEFDPAGNLVFSWSAIDHIHPTEFVNGWNYNSADFDYAHANSIAQDDDGHLMISFRHLDAVYKIDHTTGQVIWRLGGNSSDFTFPNDPDGFSGQHSARRMVNGNYGLFDNGNVTPPPRVSRGVEYILDTVNWTATKVFQYDDNGNTFAPSTGSYQHDVWGYRCIGWGNVRRPEPSATLLDESGDVISQIHFKDTIVSYRTWAYELPFTLTRPEITCTNDGNSITLSAPLGFNDYLWSTGETTSSITLADTGTYMVWVDHGIGMMGSFPEVVTDLNYHCGIVGIDENALQQDAVVGYFDLWGREVTRPVRGQLLLVRYASGKVVLQVN